MIAIRPKLSRKECDSLRKHVDQRGGMQLTAAAVGVTRATLHKVLLAGTCSEETAEKIRTFLKKSKKTA